MGPGPVIEEVLAGEEPLWRSAVAAPPGVQWLHIGVGDAEPPFGGSDVPVTIITNIPFASRHIP